MVPAFPVPGTFDWLVGVFKTHQKWKEIDHKTQRFYEQGLALFANHKLKDGSRAGSKQITDFTKGFVDAIYAKLLVVEGKDANGNIVMRERRRSANAAMTACRRAWFVGQRAQETQVPQINPFSRMGLKTRAPGHPARETPTATWDELIKFIQMGAVPLPKSADPARQAENADIFDFALTESELAAITALGQPNGRLWGGDPMTNEEM